MAAKVLIADDDADNRAIAQEALSASGYQVIMAANGEEALEKCIQERPDVLLLDMSMPKLNGWQVAKRVRQTSSLAHTPIVAFTAHALAGDDIRAKEAGCDDYLVKPCLPREVVAKVARWATP